MTTETKDLFKVLWKRHHLPDNYVPDSFLSSLSRNTNVTPYSYWMVVDHACAVSQQLSGISTFLSIFVHLYSRRLDPRMLVLLVLLFFPLGYIFSSQVTVGSTSKETRAKAVKSSILVLLTLLALSPILRTLTASTSSDSIWALAACLFVLNGLLSDYGVVSRAGVSERLVSVISINAALSASVVLASRLPDDTAVFTLMLLSVLMFGQSSIQRRNPVTSLTFHRLAATAVLGLIAVSFASTVSRLHAIISGSTIAFATFGAPGLLIWAQQFKNEIRGPWDVVAPVIQ